MLIQSFHLEPWRQFRAVDIDFSDRLTIITGINGCGKTTILGVLARLFQNFVTQMITTPTRLPDGRAGRHADVLEPEAQEARVSSHPRGKIVYGDGNQTIIEVPSNGGPSYALNFRHQRTIPGVFMPARRPPLFYQQTDTIKIGRPDFGYCLTEYMRGYDDLYSGAAFREPIQGKPAFKHPTHSLKQTLISLAFYAKGLGGDPDLICHKALHDFQKILQTTLSVFKFEGLKVMESDLLIKTRDAEFAIEAASGGLSAIIELVWPIFLCQQFAEEFVVLIDEPENHLHPALQQHLLPSLLEAFPSTQFIVATHSPLIISSVEHSKIFCLHPDYERNENGIVSTELRQSKKSLTPNAILRDILGLEQTLPVWVSDEIARITDKFTDNEFTPAAAEELHAYLEDLGLSNQMSNAVKIIMDKQARK